MDAKQFLAEFGHIANAPRGLEQLRQMIYNLAITGALVPQQPEDGDAHILLAKIEQNRQRLIQAKTYKRLPKLESEPIDVPENIVLPSSWCWTRLLDIGGISPRNEADDNELAAFIPMSGVSQLHRGSLICETRTWGEIKKGFTHFANGDVVVAKITPCFENGKAAVISGLENTKGIGAGTTELHVFRSIHPYLLPEYVYLFLRSPYFCVEGEQNMTGTAGQKRLPTDYFATRAMPLPPHKEQQRIVSKVDELMALCDKLETQQQQRRNLQNNLRQSTLQAVATATSPHELQTNWTRLADNFGQLFHEPEDIAELRQLAMDLAVRGLLTKQNLNEESAIDLLRRFAAEKQKAQVSGKKRRGIEADETVETNAPYELPSGWLWSRLEQAASEIQYGYTASANIKQRECLFLRITDIQNDRVAWESVPGCVISENEIPRYALQNGDIVIARTGGTIGKSYLVRGLDRISIFASYLIRIGRLESSCPEYTKIFLGSSFYWNQLYEKSMGTGQPNVSGSALKSLLFPLPPIAEQRRIVERVAQLMRFCDALEAQLLNARELAGRIALAAIANITGIVNESEENEPLKAPKTELVAPLRLGTPPSIKEQAPLAALLAHQNGEMAAKDLWQRFGGEIDAFYAQLKLEVGKGWILEPEVAKMRQMETA